MVTGVATIAVTEMNNREIAIGSHGVAGGVNQSSRQLRARQKFHGFNTARDCKVPNQQVHSLVKIGIDVMNKLAVAGRKGGARLAGVGA